MSYKDNSMVALRHIGRHRFSATGIGAYRYVDNTPSGTLTAIPTEAEIIAGGKTIILTLVNGTWLDAGTDFDSVRQDIINGLRSNKSEVTGWNALVRDVLAVTAVARTSAAIVTITLPAIPLYKITADEKLHFQVPHTAVIRGVGNSAANAQATVTNDATAVTCVATGTAVAGGVLESEIVTGGQDIILTLTSGTWVVAGAAAFDLKRQAIINGLVSAGAEAAGWNVEVKAKAAVTAVVRTSHTVVTVTLPATAGYVVTADETVTVTVPKEAVALADVDIVATPTIPITANS